MGISFVTSTQALVLILFDMCQLLWCDVISVLHSSYLVWAFLQNHILQGQRESTVDRAIALHTIVPGIPSIPLSPTNSDL